MPMCLSFQRRCGFFRTKRNRTSFLLTLILICGLYVLGYQKGSLWWTKKEDFLVTPQHNNPLDSHLPAQETIEFKELASKDTLVNLADETSLKSREDAIDEDPGLVIRTKTSSSKSDENPTKSTKVITKKHALDFTVSTTSSYQLSSFTAAKQREPSTSNLISHEQQRSSPRVTSSTTRKVQTSKKKYYISPKNSLKQVRGIHVVPSASKITKMSKEKISRSFKINNLKNTRNSILKKRYDEISLQIPIYNQSHSDHCPPNVLDQNRTWSYGECVPHQASKKSCEVEKLFYQLEPSLIRCRNDLQITICDVNVNPHSLDINVQCNKSLCEEHTKPSSILFLSLHSKAGFLKVMRKFQTVEQLEKNLTKLIKANIKKKVYFVVLRCTLKGTKRRVSQLITVDPALTIRTMNDTRSRDVNQINVNILLLDSVSRAHFYRSLPKTLEVFKTWKNNPKTSPAKVFDFELFQALEGHTAENTHALFNGKLFPPNEERSDRKPVNPGNMFGTFSRAGYQTMWQEDLCWTGGWGLLTDLGARSWRQLVRNIKQHYIDHTGITHSSCEILTSLGVNSPFFGPLGNQICYNGRFQHSYLLQYTLDTLKAITSTSTALPLLSYTSLSVGHDPIGRRIQSLDPALVEYVNELSLNEETLTVVLSDHGNTYTSYTSTLQGRFEMFHPHLFLIVPNKVAQRLGKDALNALRVNQHRLVNMIDLHHSIMALSEPLDGPVTPTGLFTPISAQRTCDHFELRLPNLCVCQGWDIPAFNDSSSIAFVEFAVGQLNNKIEEKRIVSGKDGSSCVRLYATRYGNVRERKDISHGTLLTSMDLFIPAGDVVEQEEDLFHVEVKSYEVPGQRSLNMKLTNFDRVTTYGKYAVCADEGVPLKLCICSKTKQPRKWYPRFIPHQDTTFLGQKPLVKKISHCVFFLARRHFKKHSPSTEPQSFGFELINTCFDASFNVSVHAVTKNIKLSRDLPFIIQLTPSSTRFLLSAKKDLARKSTIDVNVKIQSRMTIRPLILNNLRERLSLEVEHHLPL